MKKITLKERIKKHLKQKKKISSMQAFRDFGITRLSAIIYELRREGLDVKSKNRKCKNRYGDTVYFYDYYLGGYNGN